MPKIDKPFIVVQLAGTDTPDAFDVIGLCDTEDHARQVATTYAMSHEGRSYGMFQRIDIATQERRVEWTGS